MADSSDDVTSGQCDAQMAPSGLRMLFHQRNDGQETVPQAARLDPDAHGDAAAANVSGRNADRLVQFQSGPLLVLRRSNGGTQLPDGRRRPPPEHGPLRADGSLRLRAQAGAHVGSIPRHVPQVQSLGQGV